MAGWIVAAGWFGPGFVLGYRAAQARLRWLDALAEQGEIPERGSTLAFRWWQLTPSVLVRSARAIAPYEFLGKRSPHGAVEALRAELDRLNRLFLMWMILGAPVAFLVAFALALVID